jgi:hypothetical protein
MPKPYIKVLLDFVRTAPEIRVTRANAVYTGMKGNPKYPRPPVALAELKGLNDNYATAIAAAAQDGGKNAIAVRDQMGETVVQMLRKLAHYVEAVCEGEMDTFLSSGFAPAPASRIQTPPLSKSIRHIRPGPNSGTILLSLMAQKDAFSYEIRWCIPNADGTPGEFSSRPVATVRPASLITNLIPGTSYMFQVRTVTKTGYTDWGQPATRMCT